MSETFIVALLGIAGALLSGVISFVLGRRAERHRQALAIRAEMLEPIDDWLQGTEKMVGILGDTISSITSNSPVPINYNFEERREAANFMIENTNIVIGILASEILSMQKTTKLSKKLKFNILLLDNLVKQKLLPTEMEILDRSANGSLNREFVIEVGKLKLQIDSVLQDSYSLIAQMKTAFT